MDTLLTLEMVTLVNGLAIQHSSEWEDYLEMNAQINGMTKEEYAAYYLGTQWQMQCMESLQRLTEKKVTRKQLDKAINDVAAITDKLKKVVKEWAAARDAGKTEKQEEKLQELKKLNDDKTAAQKVVDDHIQQLDKNATLQTTESVNEKKYNFDQLSKMWMDAYGEDMKDEYHNFHYEVTTKYKNKVTKKDVAKIWMDIYGEDMKDEYDGFFNSIKEAKSEFKEGDKVKLTLKGLQQMNRHRIPGISNNYSRSLGKIRDKDIAGTVEKVFPSGSMNVRFDGVLYDIKDYMVVKESVNEAVSRSTKIYCVATPAPRKQLVEKLKDIFGDDYRNIVTEFTDDEGYESVLLFNLTRNDIALIQKRVADVLIWEYSIKKGKEIMESLNEKIKVASLADAIDAERDGDLNKRHLDKILKRKEDGTIHQMTRSEEKTYHAILRKYKIQEAIDIDMINTEYGFWGTMDQYYTYRSIETAFEDAMNYLIGSYNFTQQGAYNFLNSKWGRKLADEYHDGVYSIINTIDDFGNKSTWKKYTKMFNEAKENSMKNLRTLESFTINEAMPKYKASKEEENLIGLRDEIRRARKGGAASRYTKEFDTAKKRALKAIEDMITYAKIGV